MKFKYLTEKNLTYYNHLKISIWIAKILFISSIKAFIHAIYPDIYTKSAINTIKQLYNYIENEKNSIENFHFLQKNSIENEKNSIENEKNIIEINNYERNNYERNNYEINNYEIEYDMLDCELP
jgi:hypothetical protein